jgi:hypothetical protein
MDKFFIDFDYFWGMIEKGENFTFSRYADGEVMLMKGNQVDFNTQAYKVDKWGAPNHLTKLGSELFDSLKHTENNYYYAISSTTDNKSDYDFLNENITQSKDKLTFVNLWINANYLKMKKNLCKLTRDVVVFCNHKATKDNFPFNVIDITKFPDDCVNFWENNSEAFKTEITQKYKDYNNTLFLISCGPASEVIIDALYKSNPNNTYIDVGSSIDEFVHGYQTRPYMDPTSQYYNMISKF